MVFKVASPAYSPKFNNACATPPPNFKVGFATRPSPPHHNFNVGSATPAHNFKVGSATPPPNFTVGSATPYPDFKVGSATPSSKFKVASVRRWHNQSSIIKPTLKLGGEGRHGLSYSHFDWIWVRGGTVCRANFANISDRLFSSSSESWYCLVKPISKRSELKSQTFIKFFIPIIYSEG